MDDLKRPLRNLFRNTCVFLSPVRNFELLLYPAVSFLITFTVFCYVFRW